MRIELQKRTTKYTSVKYTDIHVWSRGQFYGVVWQDEDNGTWNSPSAHDGTERAFVSIRDAIRHLLGRIK